MAVFGWVGMMTWYLWFVVLVMRKSCRSRDVPQLYDFYAMTMIIQSKAILGSASAAFTHTQPESLLTLVFIITAASVVRNTDCVRGGPCRFRKVNCVRSVGLITANLTSVIVLFWWLLAGGRVVWARLLLLVVGAALTGLFILAIKRLRQRPRREVDDTRSCLSADGRGLPHPVPREATVQTPQ